MIDYDQILLLLDQIIPQTGNFPGLMQALTFIRDLLLQITSFGGGLPGLS